MPKISRPGARLLGLLKLIYRHGQVSRSVLIEQAGYSGFLVAKMCEELLRAGLIYETGPGSSTGGRPPTLLSINADLGWLIGLHIGTVNARIVVTDIAGRVLVWLKAPSRVQEGPDIAIAHLFGLVDEAIERAGVTQSQLRGIGIGISGVLDRAQGVTLFWPKIPHWLNVPVRDIFADRFRTVVEIEDSPRTMALAERRLGVGSEESEFIYVMVGAGTGCALFLRGEIYTGFGGFAGEFGHMTVDENGPLCSCGNRGCLEALVSAGVLIRQARQAVSQGLAAQLWQLCQGDPDKISVELIAQAAAENDRFSLNLLNEAGMHLGMGIVGLVNLFNPALIVIGGGVALAARALLLGPVRQVVRQRALRQPSEQVRIELSNLDEQDWARGAALLVTDKALEVVFSESLDSVEVRG